MKHFTHKYAILGAMVTVAALNPGDAFASGTGLTPVSTSTYTGTAGGFSTIFERVTTSFGGVTGLISMFAYLLGIVFAIGGILKVKEHVEEPTKTDLKAGAMRLVAGGALFALPFVMDVMQATIGDSGSTFKGPQLHEATFNIKK